MVITVSNLYGCGALAIAQRVAERLGLEYVDEQLPVVVAKRLRTTPEAVESAEDLGATVGERMLRGLELGTPEVSSSQRGPSFDEACLREVQEAVREYAAHGNVVLIGRGAGAILGRRPDVVRVLMHAPRDWRIQHLVDAYHVSEAAATAEVDRIDRARAKHMEATYGLKWIEARNYDLCLDVASLGTERCIEAIVSAVRTR